MITFPRAMPPCRIAELSKFDLMHGVAVNTIGSGSVQAMELSAALWNANFTTEPLSPAQRAAVQAWWATLRGGIGTFYARDCFRMWPAAYHSKTKALALNRAGGGAFDGTCTVSSNGVTTVSLANLPAAYQFTEGDLVELPRASGRISLHQVTESVSANGAGVAVVSIEPPALNDTSVGSTAARLYQARCIMVPKPGTLDIPVGLGKRAATFEAVQTLK